MRFVSRRMPLALAATAAAVATAAGSVSAQAGLLDDLTNTANGLLDDPVGGVQDTVGGVTDGLNNGLNGGNPGGGNPGLPLPGGSGILPGSPTSPYPTAPVPGDGTTGDDSGTATGDSGRGLGGRGSNPTPAERREARRERREARREARRERAERQGADYAGEPAYNPDGSPTDSNPTLSLADFGPAPIGMPNFIIDRFTIPPFLLPIYQACGTEYGVPWYVLASINRIETAFGTNLNVSTAGAQGWMQFMPATWKAYGVDANNDGRKDPYNPVDAICAAANYLEASGARGGPPRSDLRLQPRRLVRRRGPSLRPPVREHPRRPGQLDHGPDRGRALPGRGERPLRGRRVRAQREGASDLPPSPTRRGINIYSEEGASAVAVNDGTIQKIGQSKRLGKYVVLEDNYGNRFTYAELGSVAEAYPVPRERERPCGPPTARTRTRRPKADAEGRAARPTRRTFASGSSAFPERDGAAPMVHRSARAGVRAARVRDASSRSSGRSASTRSGWSSAGSRRARRCSPAPSSARSDHGGRARRPHLNFAIRPAGRGAPQINPKPILDGWKLLEATHLYRAMGKDPFADSAAEPGQVLLMSKEQAARALVAESRRLDLRVRAQRCPQRPDRRADHAAPALSRAQRLRPHGHLAQVRPRRLYELGQRQRPLGRKRRRHRPDQRPAGPRQPGDRLHHRDADQDRSSSSRAR